MTTTILISGVEFKATPIGEAWGTRNGSARQNYRIEIDPEERIEVMHADLVAQAKQHLRMQGLKKTTQATIDAYCEKIALDDKLWIPATDVRTVDGQTGYISRHASDRSLVVTIKTGENAAPAAVAVTSEEEIAL